MVVQYVQHLYLVLVSPKMQLFSLLRPRLPYCLEKFAPKLHPKCTTA